MVLNQELLAEERIALVSSPKRHVSPSLISLVFYKSVCSSDYEVQELTLPPSYACADVLKGESNKYLRCGSIT